jgi:hypothetical protein
VATTPFVAFSRCVPAERNSMSQVNNGAHRASSSRAIKLALLSFLTLALAFGGFIASPTQATAASQIKVVIVVGPVEGTTARYIEHAREYAAEARAYGANVIEVYSPRATWTRVKAAAVGANIFIYLGHGNGYPSPYGAFTSLRRNGMGLNSSLNNGNSNVKYWGQYYMRTGLDLARNSVVLLNHLCYASGNSEPGRKLPSKSVAMQRADGYGTGFLRTGARAMFATGNGSLNSVIADLLTSDKTVAQMFQDDWSFTGEADFKFASAKTSWSTVWMDPHSAGKYYHAVSGNLNLTATQVRAGG